MARLKRYFYLIGAALVIVGFGRFTVLVAWDRWNSGLAGAGLVILAAAVVVNRAEIAAWYSDRRGAFALSLMVAVVLLLGILALLNLAAFYHPLKADLTRSKRNTLEPETRDMLHRLTKDVTVSQFARVRDSGIDAQLRRFAAESPHVHADFVDLDKQPLLARQMKIVKNGTILVESGDKRKKLEATVDGPVTESDIATAILSVTTSESRAICFTTGHGEHVLTDQSGAGLTLAKEAIEATNYRVDPINLVEGDPPADCMAVVLAGPQREIFAGEIDRLAKYAAGGGRLLVLIDPPPAPALADLLGRWGVKPADDIVLDTSAGNLVGAGPTMAMGVNYGDHPVTRGLETVSGGKRFETLTLYSLARSLTPLPDEKRQLQATALVRTGTTSFAKTDVSSASETYNAARDIKGPLTLAVAGSWPVERQPPAPEGAAPPKKPREARAVVFGDSDFITNSLIRRSGNNDLMLNALSWLAGDADLVSVKPRKEENRRVELSERARRVLFALVIFVVPAVPLAIGLVVVFRRLD